MSSPAPGRQVLDLRVDIDPRYPNSPVTNRISGDLYEVNSLNVPGSAPQTWRVYRESWTVDNATTTWHESAVEITGTVRFWKGVHPTTTLKLTIPWGIAEGVGPAHVMLAGPDGAAGAFSCTKRSDSFRDLSLEVDVCQSVNRAPILPAYRTDQHPMRPDHLPTRVLTIEEAYREAGVRVTIAPDHTVIDDAARQGRGWTDAELHDAMDLHFSEITAPWPRWALWGLMAGTYENERVGGVMFDAAAAYGGAGRAPERQGFAVFRNHAWFTELTANPPQNAAQAEAMRKFLYTWVHEAGHAFNFLHSWDKNRPNALSWMNYDWKYDQVAGSGGFWSNFRFRFDEEELVHVRHGNRAAVIMGADPWASGGTIESPPGAEYLEAAPGAMSHPEGQLPLELLVRTQDYFEFMEPVVLEVRLRNLLPTLPITVDTPFNPEYGVVGFYIRRPGGRIMQYAPVACKAAPNQSKVLSPSRTDGSDGTDRHSETVFLSYGKYGFYFDEPGEYLVRAVYQGAGDILIPSNIARLRIGRPASVDDDRLASDFFSYDVGMILYLYGSRSPRLAKGWNFLTELVERSPKSMRAVRIRSALANSLTRPFHQVVRDGTEKRVVQSYRKESEAGLAVIAPAVQTLQERGDRHTNILLNQMGRRQAELKAELSRVDEAVTDLGSLRHNLASRGVNTVVLRDLDTLAKKLSARS